jgi:class 3 adenylate cyclase
MSVRRRLAAIMAADVVGYSRLMGRDEEGTLRRVKSLIQEIVRPSVAEHHGRVVKTMGDGFLVEFASVVEAFHCAVKLQHETEARNEGVAPDERIRMRIGINIGDIIRDAGDVFGEGVNIAARLEGMAKPGGICVSGRAWEDLRQLKLPFKDLGELQLKNIDKTVRAYSLGPEGAPDEPPTAPPPSQPSERATRRGRGLALAAVGVAGVVLAGAGAAALVMQKPKPKPAPDAYVAAQLAAMPCSWLRVSDHSSIDGVEVYKLSGSSSAEPAAIARTLMTEARARGVDVDKVITSDVAPLYARQCAWIDGLKGFRYMGIPRFNVGVKPMGRGVTRATVTFDAAELGPAGAIYGVEPSGRVERIIDRGELAGNPAVVANPDGSYTLSLDIDHVGWNGLVFLRSEAKPPDGVIERPIEAQADRQRFESLARSSGWRFELAWFRVG